MQELDKQPLSEAEIAALPDGAAILVIWSGGNDPHRYTLKRRNGRAYATMEFEVFHELDFIGFEQPYTQVWAL